MTSMCCGCDGRGCGPAGAPLVQTDVLLLNHEQVSRSRFGMHLNAVLLLLFV